MATLFLILFVIAILHFAFNAIILPQLRLELRYHLFKLRDELRLIKCDDERKIDDEVFNYLNNSINNCINHIPYFNIGFIYQVVKEVKRNPELKKHIDKRTSLIKNCPDERVKRIYIESSGISFLAFLLNSAVALFIPMLIAVPILLLIKKAKPAKNKCEDTVQRTNYIYPHESPVLSVRYKNPKPVSDNGMLVPA